MWDKLGIVCEVIPAREGGQAQAGETVPLAADVAGICHMLPLLFPPLFPGGFFEGFQLWGSG